MNFNVSSKTLYTVTSAVGKVINSRNALQILNNFHFAIEGNQLTVTASDVENAISARIEVTDVEGSGTFCIDAHRLNELLKEIPDVGLQFVINDDTYEVEIKYSNDHFQMVALPGDQYPQYKKEETDEEPVTFQASATQLLSGLENTLFATGNDDFHPQMMGIRLDIRNNGITFVATDTRKLVRYIDNTYEPGVEIACTMPSKPASILKTVLSKEGLVSITMTTKSASFEYGPYTFNCRFIKGNYPDYNRVIPSNNPYLLKVDRMRFLNTVRRVGVFVDPGYGLEKFMITSSKITVKSSDASMQSEGKGELDCEYSGPDMAIGFSAPFLIEICSTLSTDEILIKLADPSRPGVFVPTENAENTDLLMLLMPMSLAQF